MAVAAAVVAFCASADHAGRLVILEKGIFRSTPNGTYAQPGSMGPVSRLNSVTLLQSTQEIPASLATRFGVRYVVDGPEPGTTVNLRLVTRFPDGGIFDPHSGHWRSFSEYDIPVQTGLVQYREFHLDHDAELAPGLWTFEFWLNGKKLGEEKFCLFRPDADRGERVGGCGAPVS